MTDEDPPPPRKLSRDARRKQLIEATISVIAARGFARTTLTEVARVAGLSHGLVNFHFQTKELLLSETLAYLSAEYHENWQRAVAAAGDDPAAQLDAMIRADFTPDLCTAERLSAWCAFWGETQGRPLYQEECGPNDQAYIAKLESLCTALLPPGRDPVRPARVIRLTSEGVWMDIVTQAVPYGRQEGLQTVLTAAAAFFPDHFPARPDPDPQDNGSA
jgi:TetR/AcrR family transcriptional repressor of bet genes